MLEAAPADGMIRRRHVFYVEGYDPQGAEGYYGIFQRASKRFQKVWPIAIKLGPLRLDSELQAHWDIKASGPNWQVSTRYEFLRQEHIIRANMAEPLWRQVARAAWWAITDITSGALARIFRASWRYGLALLSFQGMLLLWFVTSGAVGALLGFGVTRRFELPAWVGIVTAVPIACAVFVLLRPLADIFFVVQINNHWPYLREYARGAASCFDAPVEACARRVVEAARANDADELLVIGHSGGGMLAPAVIARALELDPDVGRRGPRLILLTLGSLMPGAALHPSAEKMRRVVRRIATEPSIRWIDCQARKDILNFWDFDPVEGIGVHLGPERCNPTIWQVRFRDMLLPDFYRRLRWSLFRMHYQFIMANDRQSPYDYLMLVAGPVPVEEWSNRRWELVNSFTPEGAFSGRTSAVRTADAASASDLNTSVIR
jgi:hypothetical protein